MIRLIFFVLLASGSAYGQYVFSDMEYIDIESSDLEGKFGYNKNSDFQLINRSCIKDMECYKYYDLTTLIGYWHLNDCTKIEFHYTEAPSDDPKFIAVYNDEIILEEAGSTLHFKENTLYVEGSSNSFFDRKRKFEFTNQTYQEVNQPFYYIGMTGKLNYPIEIYKTDKFLEKLAYLPTGYDIEVLVGCTGGEYNQLEKVLIKTEFGLAGWFNFKEMAHKEPIIDDLYYHGD